MGSNPDGKPITYREAGVDIDAGSALVAAIKPLARATRRPGAGADLGGFGALFDLAQAGYNDPLLVAATDGVGTKLDIAIASGRHDTIGVDLVAMCVNDLLAQGAEPLFFLDYYATGKLDVAVARPVVSGIADGCREAGCALIGGETAEMPGFYPHGKYDLAGFAVGAVERDGVLPRGDIEIGDALIGLPSSGVHSNGYSLVRRLVTETRLGWNDPAPWCARGQTHGSAPSIPTLADALLTPTRIYVKQVLSALRATGAARGPIKAIAHITGGGLSENVPRVLPPGVAARIDLSAWSPPPVFGWLARTGRLDGAEMLRTFNCGIGLVIVVAKAGKESVCEALRAEGETPIDMGEIVAGTGAKSAAKGGGEAEAVQFTGRLEH